MSGDHNMYQKSKSYLDDFECPRCGHCCQALVDETAKRKHIKTWHERCEEHPDHQTGMISERMIQERMQEEIDELRQALETEPEALRLADALDAEFVQGRISNSTGRESAVELRRLALKQWVGLTAPEVQECYNLNPARFASRIEAKLKEKNHGH